MASRLPFRWTAGVRSATKVPKEIDEKHELSKRWRDSGARMRAARAPESMIMISYIDTHI
jgi:hypothetical protein